MNRPLGENLTKETGGLSSSMSVLRHCPVALRGTTRARTGGSAGEADHCRGPCGPTLRSAL